MKYCSKISFFGKGRKKRERSKVESVAIQIFLYILQIVKKLPDYCEVPRTGYQRGNQMKLVSHQTDPIQSDIASCVPIAIETGNLLA